MTQMQTTSYYQFAFVNGEPKVLSLKELITITRASKE